MGVPVDILTTRTDLDAAARDHLGRLTDEWAMLADFCFSDLVLYVRDRDDRYLMARHVRPATSQTIYETDVVGEVRTAAQRPLIHQAFRDGASGRGDIDSAWLGERVRVDAIPVRLGGRVIAVLAREFFSAIRLRPGELEQTYERVFARFAAMIAAGAFPFPQEDVGHATMPRVGDGVVVLGRRGQIEYSSPNATSTLTRSGVDRVVRGSTLAELGFDVGAVRSSLGLGRPMTEELERPGDVTLVVRVLPFVDEGSVRGAVVLIRDISDVRRRDRLLLSKDATISEIHHRVKNNLQTISSLLRLQGRRLTEPSARAAVEESVRRIRSIALVHETLSREPGDDVEFREVLKPLVRMVNEGLVSSEHPIRFEIDGDGGVVSSEVATSLSLVVTELLQNAVEHAFPADRTSGEEPLVRIVLAHDADSIRVEVVDNGVGVGPAFDPAAATSLGQSIVQALVQDELRGAIGYRQRADGPGTSVVLEVSSHKQWD
ncbi:MAG: histidine kinase N-terminal domain-containing protein [Acidimicrobiales bacterium]